MRHNIHDKTLYRNYVRKWKFLIQEYELVKQKRHPKWKSRRVYGYIEQQVLLPRRQGVNRYEICQLLAPKLKHLIPSPSTGYRIPQRYGLNRLTPPLKQEKRRIVKRKAGELGHLDCHHLSKDLIATDPTRSYLVWPVRAWRGPRW